MPYQNLCTNRVVRKDRRRKWDLATDLDPHKKQSSFSQAVENQPSDSVIS